MTFTLVVRPDVDADLREAEVWYEQQAPGLGRRFLQESTEADTTATGKHELQASYSVRVRPDY